MSLGSNIAFLRKMHNQMTQEELAEKLQVSRQTVSKWELDNAFPEMEKAIILSRLFNCSMDELIIENMDYGDKAFSDIRVEELETFRYIRYAVISPKPEDDAMTHMRQWTKSIGIESPELIGWDFPFVSQEQTNVFHMHGYCAACILPKNYAAECKEALVQSQAKYAAITIENPFEKPFVLIPNAYKTLLRYMEVNGLKETAEKDEIVCFEKIYEADRVTCMNIYIRLM